MKIAGLQKTTLLDFPTKVACIVFLHGCNFRCPFCHNANLVTEKELNPITITEEEFFHFLSKRKGLLDGVCISGGEPTIYQEELITFIRKIKDLDFLVKLDTNGTNPELLQKLLKDSFIDYIAMDIKNSKENYLKTIGLTKLELDKIENSIKLIKNSSIDYEFRTTVVNPLHTKDDFRNIANWIGDCNHYYLQTFQNSGHLINGEHLTNYSIEEMMEFRSILQTKMHDVRIK